MTDVQARPNQTVPGVTTCGRRRLRPRFDTVVFSGLVLMFAELAVLAGPGAGPRASMMLVPVGPVVAAVAALCRLRRVGVFDQGPSVSVGDLEPGTWVGNGEPGDYTEVAAVEPLEQPGRFRVTMTDGSTVEYSGQVLTYSLRKHPRGRVHRLRQAAEPDRRGRES